MAETPVTYKKKYFIWLDANMLIHISYNRYA